MAAARDFATGRGPGWAALLLALAGHGAVIATLMAISPDRPAGTPPRVLAVKWVGEERPAVAKPESSAMPRPLPVKPQAPPIPRNTAVPAATVAHAQPAPATPAAPEVPAATPAVFAAAASPASAEPAPLVPSRFGADYLSNPAPDYPPASRAMGEQGTVFLRVLVSAQGGAQEVRLRTGSGFDRLDLAALEAVRRWRFVPARQGDEAVAAWVVVPISFTLRRQ